jgi:hypothetical protein
MMLFYCCSIPPILWDTFFGLFLCAFVSLRLCVTLFAFVSYSGSSLLHSRRAMPITLQQRHPPSLSPNVRHNGGCSRVCRRFLWHKIRTQNSHFSGCSRASRRAFRRQFGQYRHKPKIHNNLQTHS